MDDHTNQLLLLAREHFRNREFSKAEPLLKQVVSRKNHYADVFDMLGVIAHAAGDFRLARDWFERALALNANYTEAQVNLMVTLNELGDFEGAQAVLASLRRKAPSSATEDSFVMGKIANMHANLSQAYSDVNMSGAAMRELERAVELCPNFPDLRTRLGVLYRDEGNPEAAREQFERAIQINSGYVRARLMLGVLHLSAGHPDQAAREFEKVLQNDPEDPNARMYLRLTRRLENNAPPAGAAKSRF